MNDLLPLDLSPENARSLRTLVRSVNLLNEREFALKLVRCNYHDLRRRIMAHLQHACALPIHELMLGPDTPTLAEAIETAFNPAERAELRVLSIQGFEQVKDLESLFSAANQVRDAFHQRFPFLIMLWMTDDVFPFMIKRAPDFYNWAASPSTFVPSREELLQILSDQTEQLWAGLLQPSGPLFPHAPHPNSGDTAAFFSLQSWELQALQHDLDAYTHALHPESKAHLGVLWGRDYFCQVMRTSFSHDRTTRHKLEQAIAHYQESREIWLTLDHPVRAGVVGVHLGLSYWRQAEGDRAHQETHWQVAEQHFRDAMDGFERGNRPDLKARFIGSLSETLKRLQQWDELETVVDYALGLHQPDIEEGDRYGLERARDYGFKAELALQRQASEQAQNHVEEALAIGDRLPYPGPDRSLFLSLLAQAHHQLGNLDLAKQHFRAALDNGSKADNPQLYIGILEQLRDIYFQQKDYRTAFECKRKKTQLQNQYGFQAFIGAGRLRPKEAADGQITEVSPEIAVSGRQRDVDALWERIVDKQRKLTILHGPLGVGKSSILQAGLIPTLQTKRIETRKVLSVMTRTYTNCQWAEKLGGKLSSQLQKNIGQSASELQSADTILTQLQENSRSNLVTVLIFDQFEEFFFNCREISERHTFFNFLGQCLNIPYVNVILSLREDYLHYLLEWERYAPLQPEGPIQIYENILSQNHRYSLGNFSPEDARAILDTLTERAQFHMEEELRDRIVQGLTVHGKVKPIELQVIGVQLQIEEVITLNKYLSIGKNQKEILVQKYLERIVQDCGVENKKAAKLILYALTDENNTRPPRTRHEIESEIQILEEDLLKEVSQIDLVLHVFQRSGLIFLIPEIPDDRYQLVHDYLVTFIRSQKPILERIAAELKQEREKRFITQEKLRISELERIRLEDKSKIEQKEREKIQLDLKISKLQIDLEEEKHRNEKNELEKKIKIGKLNLNFLRFSIFSLITIVALLMALIVIVSKSFDPFKREIIRVNNNKISSNIRTAMANIEFKSSSLYCEGMSDFRYQIAILEVMDASRSVLDYKNEESEKIVIDAFRHLYSTIIQREKLNHINKVKINIISLIGRSKESEILSLEKNRVSLINDWNSLSKEILNGDQEFLNFFNNCPLLQ